MFGRKKKPETSSPSKHSEKWDEEERKFKEKMAGPKNYPKHEWGYDPHKQERRPKKSKLKFW